MAEGGSRDVLSAGGVVMRPSESGKRGRFVATVCHRDGHASSSDITHASPSLDCTLILPPVSSDGPSGHAAEPEVVCLAPLRSPEASLRSIRVRPGFTVELVAGEPLVTDPVAFDWGADGKLWVVEMGDYPLGVDGKGKPGGPVRILEDTDGDGRYDKVHRLPRRPAASRPACMPWRKGVIVACAPDILYAEDTDGDGKADQREVLFTGFGEGNQQHRVNGFELRPRRLGLRRQRRQRRRRSSRSRRARRSTIRGRDFRFRPDNGAIRAESGQTQFGRHRDDWGNWFGSNNTNPMLALRPRRPLPPPQPARRRPRPARRSSDADDAALPDQPDARAVQRPRTRPTASPRPTARRSIATTCSARTFAGNLFVSEPVHNLVHRDGARARRARPSAAVGPRTRRTASSWPRPTTGSARRCSRRGPTARCGSPTCTAPSSSTPSGSPTDWQARLDLRAGNDKGRIYRVFPVDRKPRPIPRLDRLDTAGLVAALDSPNGWQRDTAQRLLLQRGDSPAIAPLRELAAHTEKPQTRVQALWTLADLGGLDESTALAALADPTLK